MSDFIVAAEYLDVFSINLWQILISLANLVILFLILKKFLYAPVQKMMRSRQESIEKQFDEAARTQAEADEAKAEYADKLAHAEKEADALLSRAAETAQKRGDAIIEESKQKADGIIRRAQTEAVLERKKATADIKKEIVDVSSALTEKMIGREINPDDHHELIRSFIDQIGDGDDANE